MKYATRSLIAFATLTMTVATWAETAQARKFNASRARVEAACGSGGGAFGTRSNGAYGCVNDNGWVYCQANGRCEGGRSARRVSKNKSRAVPKARNQ